MPIRAATRGREPSRRCVRALSRHILHSTTSSVAFVRYFLPLAADRARMATNCPNCGADADTEPVVYYENIVQACANCGALR